MATLAAVILAAILIAAIAAGNRDDDESSKYYEDRRRLEENEWEIKFASAVNLPIGDAGQSVSVSDCEGRLLATMDEYGRVTNHDLRTVASILEKAQVQRLNKPIAVCLLQADYNSYRIEHVGHIHESSDDDFRVSYRRIKGVLYKIKMRTLMNSNVYVEVIPQLFKMGSLI